MRRRGKVVDQVGRWLQHSNRAQGPYKNLVLKNVNLAWKALQQNGFLRSDPH